VALVEIVFQIGIFEKIHRNYGNLKLFE